MFVSAWVKQHFEGSKQWRDNRGDSKQGRAAVKLLQSSPQQGRNLYRIIVWEVRQTANGAVRTGCTHARLCPSGRPPCSGVTSCTPADGQHAVHDLWLAEQPQLLPERTHWKHSGKSLCCPSTAAGRQSCSGHPSGRMQRCLQCGTPDRAAVDPGRRLTGVGDGVCLPLLWAAGDVLRGLRCSPGGLVPLLSHLVRDAIGGHLHDQDALDCQGVCLQLPQTHDLHQSAAGHPGHQVGLGPAVLLLRVLSTTKGAVATRASNQVNA